MKDDDMSDIFRQRALNDIKFMDDVEEWWQHNAQLILRKGEEILGKTSGTGPPNDKETWWNVEVAKVIKEKKVAKKEYYKERNQINRERLRAAKKAAKRAVATASAQTREEMYEELEKEEGKRSSIE